MLEITKYVRKPFYIDAVELTPDNLEEAAKWCDGEVRTDEKDQKYIKVRVHRPLNDRQTKAYVGDRILYAGTGYKVYTPKAFANSFEKVAPVGDSIVVGDSTEPPAKAAKKTAKRPVPAPPAA